MSRDWSSWLVQLAVCPLLLLTMMMSSDYDDVDDLSAGQRN